MPRVLQLPIAAPDALLLCRVYLLYKRGVFRLVRSGVRIKSE